MQLPTSISSSADYVVKMVDPYVPSVAKDAAGYVAKTGENIVQNVTKTGENLVQNAYQTASSTQAFASQKVQEAVDFGKDAVGMASTTITSYTPDPVMNLINQSMAAAKELRSDPVGAVKPYVPAFVIQAGERTYEVVAHTADSARKTVDETGGFIVTKVNGSVDFITHIPQVESLITELKKLIPRKTSTGVLAEE